MHLKALLGESSGIAYLMDMARSGYSPNLVSFLSQGFESFLLSSSLNCNIRHKHAFCFFSDRSSPHPLP